MKRRNGKGFTIVELVIVIAVIAVLAAVLIPTFSSLINKANESSDISAVRNMNTALTTQETLDGKAPESASEAMRILKEAGLNAQDYSALANGTAIYYNSAVNRMIYVRLNDAGGIDSVIFPSEYKLPDLQGSFHLLSGRLMTDKTWLVSPENKGTKADLESLKTTTDAIAQDTAYYDGNKLVGAAVASYNGLLSVAEYIETQEDGAENFTVVLGQDISLKDSAGNVQEWKPISYFAGDFYGRNHKIDDVRIKDASADSLSYAAASANSNYSFYGFVSVFAGSYFGDVTLTVDIDEPGNGAYVSTGFNRNNHTTAGAIGGVVLPESSCKIANVTVNGTIVGVNRVAGIVGFIGGYASNGYRMNANVTIENCVNNAAVTSANASGATYATAGGIVSVINQWEHGSSITVKNCTNNGTIRGFWVGGIIADAWQSNDDGAGNVTQNAVITLDGCTNVGTLIGEARSNNNDQVCVVGGIFGAYNGYRGSSRYTRAVDRYKLEIRNCENSGELKYETVAVSTCKNIYLAQIVSVDFIKYQQKNVTKKLNVDSVIALQLSDNTASGNIAATTGGSGTVSDPQIFVGTYENIAFANIDYKGTIAWN